MYGPTVFASFFQGLFAKAQRVGGDRFEVCVSAVNGASGVVVRHKADGAVEVVFVFEVRLDAVGPRIARVYAVRNPGKLATLARALDRGALLPTRPG